MKRLGIAGIHIESGTFSPMRTGIADFHALRSAEMLERYPFLAGFSEIEPVPLAHFRALPGGQVRRADYEEMKGEILERLNAAGELDGFYFDIHGAMAVEGLYDAEADLLGAIRERIGPEMPVTCSQDLHGNVSDRLVAGVDFITAYRTAPHVDWMETRERAVRLLADWWRTPRPVFRARAGIPVLVSGEMSSTETAPGDRLYAPLAAESGRPGLLDASLWVGYAWADQPRAMATAVATGTDAAAVRETAEGIARRYWDAREEFRFIAPAGPAEWCLDEALACGGRGVFISDAGDNPTAGAAGDVTATLAEALRHPGVSDAIFASIPDAAAVAVCKQTKPGAEVRLTVGGKLDPVHGAPLEIAGELLCVVAGDATGGAQAVVNCGGMRVILTERRKSFHLRKDFLALGLDPLETAITIVKIGYLEPELKAMARHHFLALSPGAVHPALESIPYRRLQRPMFPMDRGFDWEPAARVFRSF